MFRRLPNAFLWLLVLTLWCFPASAEETPDPLQFLREAPEVSVLTFGPGDAAFLKFGHNAIRVIDKKRGTDLVYNFGTFEFDSPTLILDFLTGRFRYWVSVSAFRSTLAAYQGANRSIVEQQLNMSPWAATELNEALLENARPENKYYLYDYYADNCSTRVRDVVDKAIKGGLEKRFQGKASSTLREHTLRAVADDFWLYLGLDIAMGAMIDQPITRYQEMFLPEKLRQGLGSVVFSGVHGTQAFVKETKVWHEARGRARLRSKPPERTLGFFQTGAVVGGLFAFMGWEAYKRRKRWAEIALPLSLGVLGTIAGLLGLLFVGLWAFTDHQVAHRNENILQCAPWALGLTVSAYGVFRMRLRWLKWAQRISAACLAASVLGLVLKLLPAFGQDNQRIIALFLPVWLGAFVAITLMLQKGMRLQRYETAPASLPSDNPADDTATGETEADESGKRDDEEDADEEEKHPSTIPPEPAPA